MPDYRIAMASARRVIDPESIYHVMCRGSDKKLIAHDAVDFENLSAGLSLVATRYRGEGFAWCLMHNHYHVVLRTDQASFSRGFQVLNQTHSIRTNKRHEQSAHLFRNRPHCVEVASDAHLVAVIVYVVRNPIRAGICLRAWEWPYSSYRPIVGLAPAPRWLAVEAVLELYGGGSEFARTVHAGQYVVSESDEATPE